MTVLNKEFLAKWQEENEIHEEPVCGMDYDRITLKDTRGREYVEACTNIWVTGSDDVCNAAYLGCGKHGAGILLRPLFGRIDGQWYNLGTGQPAPEGLTLPKDPNYEIFLPGRIDNADWSERAEALADLSQVIVDAPDQSALYRAIIEAVTEAVNADNAYLHILNNEKNKLDRYALAEDENDFTEYRDGIPRTLGRTAWLFNTKNPITMDYEHPHEKDRIPPEALKQGVFAAVSIPLIASNQVIGMCSCTYRRRVEWTGEDLAYLREIGKVLGSQIQSMATRQKAVELELLAERKRLSSEIHDNASHLVGSLSLCSAIVQESMDRGDEEATRRGLEKLEDLSQQTIRVFRDEMLSLRVPLERTYSWVAEVSKLLRGFEERWGIHTELELDIKNNPLSLRVVTSFHLTRILNECLSNALRHAEANNITVSLYEDGSIFCLSVADDGHGFDPDDVPAGHLGIMIMKERAKATGADLAIASSSDGTIVTVTVPRIGTV